MDVHVRFALHETYACPYRRLPYWAGTWLGIYPTWQGIVAQIGAITFVVGSYLAAEHVRARKRRRVLASIPTTR